MAQIQQCIHITSQGFSTTKEYGLSPRFPQNEFDYFYKAVNKALKETGGTLLSVQPLTIMEHNGCHRICLHATITYYVNTDTSGTVKNQDEF